MKWWGYLHVLGSIQVKRFGDCYLDIDDAISSPFVKQVVFPFHADSRDEAIDYCKRFLIWIERNKYKAEKNMLDGVSKKDALEALRHMMGLYSISYIVIKTKFTVHHLEKLPGSVKDRGRWKWTAQTSSLAFSEPNQDEEVYRSNIDGADLFPRLYFLDGSFINEFREWLNMRNLEITELEAPKI